jgi:hypothetical protein
MKKLEILGVVKNMRQDWQRAIDGDTISINICKDGFCLWMALKKILHETDLFDQLEKDVRGKGFDAFEGKYWYRVYRIKGRTALIPRLNHLNRTIARLENEIKNQ